jgi:hypothetical protein
LLAKVMELGWQGQFLKEFHESDGTAMSFRWLQWANMPVEVEAGMFELIAGTLKTRVFDDVRSIEVATRKCRVCLEHDETVRHLVAGCPVWFFTYFLERHNAGLKPLYWWLRFAYGVDAVMKAWHQPVTPDPIVENDKIKIWWDMPVLTDVKLEHNRPDMRVWLKDERKLFVVDMCTPYDANVKMRTEEKNTRYKALVAELRAEYRGRADVEGVSLVIGALGRVETLETELKRLVTPKDVRFVAERMQRATICGTLRLVRKFKLL